ncbi:MAG: ABC transporter substrate-binding protein [Clostridia bacterium]|nr:ABC transporter substrate-binding protein [Clostridia bacterium]
MKKTVCAILCIILCLLLAGCNKAENDLTSLPQKGSVAEVKDRKISLLYSSGDSFNPYTAKTKYNRQISRLLYDCLIKVDNDFNPVFCLAQSAGIDGKTCSVKLNQALFTDGSPVTAQDVLYSYNAAKKSDTAYAASLYEVASVSSAADTIVFTLDREDPYFLNLLDFPIFKASSDGIKTSDGVEVAPIGSGRYYVSEKTDTLLRNENYFGKKSAISEIALINAPDEVSAAHYVEVGAADIYYADESSANIVRMSGKRADVNTNNFVYIGINGYYGQLSNNLFRYALSAAIDRTQICHSAYFDNASPATGFFNPAIKDTSAVQSLKTVSDVQITVENLQKMGYNKLTDGYYTDDSGKRLSFTLLVNSDNSSRVIAANLISKHCREAGIEIVVLERTYEQYISLLSSGNFQLYLGEIRIPLNMDMSSLVVSGGSAAYGVLNGLSDESGAVATKTVCEEMISQYRSGGCSLSDLAGAFLTEMPQVPVCYRNGMLFYTSHIKNNANPTVGDIFFGLENYKF